MPVDPARAKSLFLAASELADLAKRAAYLDRECGGDAELRERVEALLRANDGALLPPVLAATMDLEHGQPQTEDFGDSAAHVGVVIAGKYSLVEVIGEGGMGSVWRAKQTEPVKRFVAVKLIKAGMDSRQVLARFDAERQALALMDHPNIAKVLDGGLHDRRPFFVMELVKGVPITEYCDSQRLTPKARLELFVPVCQAIQHAHQKGIIHRDIKPSNVLVALYDDKPVVKVIDFGVAKATGGALTEATIDTGFGNVVGTPEYMSPEQATFNNLDIDTRSDVYALGVLLYELLAGSPPFSKRELEKKGLLEMLRVVREEEPPRPSTKLSTADALPTLSANRGTEPKQLTGLLRNELDWIVMKALEKDRTRRYETANGFAADVQRYLAGEPVIAHPPSKSYRLKKFVRRNKVQVTAVSLVLFALAAGFAGTTWGLVRAERQRSKAERARNNELRQREIAQEKEAEARSAQADTEAFLRFVSDHVFAATRPAGVQGGVGVDVTLSSALATADAALDRAFEGRPVAEALARHEIGITWRNLGKHEAAVRHLRRALALRRQLLGPRNEETLLTQNSLGVALERAGMLDEAIELHEQNYRIRSELHGPDHQRTLDSAHNLAAAYTNAGRTEEALRLMRDFLDRATKVLGATHPKTLTATSSLSITLLNAGRIDEAIEFGREAVRLSRTARGETHPETISAMNNLATCLRSAGIHDEALVLIREAYELMKAKFGPEHATTLTGLSNLALCLHEQGQWDQSVPLFEEVLRKRRAALPADHPDIILSMHNLASAYGDAGKHDAALLLSEESLALFKSRLGPHHPNTLLSANNLALQYLNGRNLDGARKIWEEILPVLKDKQGLGHPTTLLVMANLAEAYMAHGESDRALAILEETLRRRREMHGPEHPDTLLSMNNLAVMYSSSNRIDDAVHLYEEAQLVHTRKLGAEHPQTLDVSQNLASSWIKVGQRDRGFALMEQVLRVRTERQGKRHPSTLRCARILGTQYARAERINDAIRLLEDALAESKESPQRFELGRALFDVYARSKQTERAVELVNQLLNDVRTRTPSESQQLAGELAELASWLTDIPEFALAENLLRECLTIRENTLPDDWTTFNTQSMLGGALFGQKKYADAEPLLIKGYEGMKAREKTIPMESNTRIPESLDRLIELYTATNKPDEVKKWQAERAKYPTAKEPVPMPEEKK